jgi:D-3-phosphoglycerate dehydrogenase / 2-oxoglutarate reductase
MSPEGSIIITDDVDELLIAGLMSAGYECDYRPEISLAELHEVVVDYPRLVGLVINSKVKADARLMAKIPGLRFIGRLGSGLDIIDLAEAKKRGVVVLAVPEGNAVSVAEHAMGMLLSLANNLVRADREVRELVWHREKNRGFELAGKTVGIIGFGHTGSAFAERLGGFHVKILAHDKYKVGFAKEYKNVSEQTLEVVLRDSDIVSLNVPLTDDTRQMVDGSFLDRCKKGVILINTSRGQVVNTAALVKALDSGQVGGACLDVFENEKPATYNPSEKKMYENLFLLENVQLSPHIAGWTVESKGKIAKYLLDKILDI